MQTRVKHIFLFMHILLGIFLFAFSVFTATAHAQTCSTDPSCIAQLVEQSCTANDAGCIGSILNTECGTAGALSGACQGAATNALSPAFAQSAQTATPITQSQSDLGWGEWLINGLLGALQKIFEVLFSLILWVPVFVSSLFLYITGSIFDFLVTTTIVNFTPMYQQLFASGVDTTWSVFRDVGNVVMIGMFVFVAIATILNSTTYGLKQFATRIVIVAVLINFSLFFTKVMIDLSNFTATQFRNSIVTTQEDGITGIFMQRAGITSLYSGTGGLLAGTGQSFTNTVGTAFSQNGSLWTYVLTTMIFFTIAGGIFLFASILLITRVLTFLLLMILSPLAFVAYMTPNMDKWWWQWWYMLLKNVIFAPIFMMLLWAVVVITGGIDGTETLLSSSQNVASAGAGFFGVGSGASSPISISALFNLAVVLGLLLASTKIASDLSIVGAKFASGISAKAIGGAFTASLMGTSGLFKAIDRGTGSRMRPGERLRNAAAQAQNLAARANLGPEVNKELNRLRTSNLQFGDSKISKALEKATGAKIGLKTAGADDRKAYQEKRAEIPGTPENKAQQAALKELQEEIRMGASASAPAVDNSDVVEATQQGAQEVRDAIAQNNTREEMQDIRRNNNQLEFALDGGVDRRQNTSAGQEESINIGSTDQRIKDARASADAAAAARIGTESTPRRPLGEDDYTRVLASVDGMKGLQGEITRLREEQKKLELLDQRKEAGSMGKLINKLEGASKHVQGEAIGRAYSADTGASRADRDTAEARQKDLGTTSQDRRLSAIEKNLKKIEKTDS